MGKLSRTKGHSYEREVAKQLRGLFPDAKRHLEMQKEEAMGFDLDNTGSWRVQCKRGARYAPLSRLKEPRVDKVGGMPVLITRGDCERSVIAFYLDDFLNNLPELVQEYAKQTKQGL